MTMTRKEVLKGECMFLKDALNKPDSNNALVILGNFAGFETVVGPVARVFIYKNDEEKWIVIDKDLGDGFAECYHKRFTKIEVKEGFSEMLYKPGYLHDASMFI